MRYCKGDSLRFGGHIIADVRFPPEQYRTDWRRDYARIIHSPSFRRLQGKTQLFPGRESDFFRNRLTHSLEVAQIAKSIAIKLNHILKTKGENYYIDLDLVEFAGLAHDIGHAPFGHFGEEALDKKMIDCGGFEGNAQTLRILATTEKRAPASTPLGIDEKGRDKRIGLNLAARSLASILKYDREIPFSKTKRKGQEGPIKGYYKNEKKVVDFIKNSICGKVACPTKFKTIECQIMDIADDIAYSTYDLEDSFKGGFLTPMDLFCASEEVIKNVQGKVNKKLKTSLSGQEVSKKIRVFLTSQLFDMPNINFKDIPKTEKDLREALPLIHEIFLHYSYDLSKNITQDSYYRTRFTSRMVRSAIDCIELDAINDKIPALSKIKLDKEKEVEIEILKSIVVESQILSPKIKIDAHRSRKIINKIFDTLANAQEEGFMLLPDDFRKIYQALKLRNDKKRLVCDFIAGMTDRYALEFYTRLTSENPPSISKPF